MSPEEIYKDFMVQGPIYQFVSECLPFLSDFVGRMHEEDARKLGHQYFRVLELDHHKREQLVLYLGTSFSWSAGDPSWYYIDQWVQALYHKATKHRRLKALPEIEVHDLIKAKLQGYCNASEESIEVFCDHMAEQGLDPNGLIDLLIEFMGRRLITKTEPYKALKELSKIISIYLRSRKDLIGSCANGLEMCKILDPYGLNFTFTKRDPNRANTNSKKPKIDPRKAKKIKKAQEVLKKLEDFRSSKETKRAQKILKKLKSAPTGSSLNYRSGTKTKGILQSSFSFLKDLIKTKKL